MCDTLQVVFLAPGRAWEIFADCKVACVVCVWDEASPSWEKRDKETLEVKTQATDKPSLFPKGCFKIPMSF